MDYQIKYTKSVIPSVLPFNKSRTKAIQIIGPHNIYALSIIICNMLGDWCGKKKK